MYRIPEEATFIYNLFQYYSLLVRKRDMEKEEEEEEEEEYMGVHEGSGAVYSKTLA